MYGQGEEIRNLNETVSKLMSDNQSLMKRLTLYMSQALYLDGLLGDIELAESSGDMLDIASSRDKFKINPEETK